MKKGRRHHDARLQAQRHDTLFAASIRQPEKSTGYASNDIPSGMARFLRMIDQTVPAGTIYLICDNYATHKHDGCNAGWRNISDSTFASRQPRLHGST